MTAEKSTKTSGKNENGPTINNTNRNKLEIGASVASIIGAILALAAIAITISLSCTAQNIAQNSAPLEVEIIVNKAQLSEETLFTINNDDKNSEIRTSTVDLSLHAQVKSGKVQSYYLVSRYGDNFEFHLLNTEGPDLANPTANFEKLVPIDMNVIPGEDDNIGRGIVYLLTVGTNGQKRIDALVIKGKVGVVLEGGKPTMLQTPTEESVAIIKYEQIPDLANNVFSTTQDDIESLIDHDENAKVMYLDSLLKEQIQHDIADIKTTYDSFSVQ